MVPVIITIVFIINANIFISDVSGYSGGPSERRELSRNGKEKMNIAKCCPLNKAVNGLNNTCIDYSGKAMQFTEVTIYDKYIHNKPINASFSDIFRVTPELRPSEANFTEFYILGNSILLDLYLSKDGILYLEIPNAYDRWIPINQTSYCLDYSVDENNTLSNNFEFYILLDGGTQTNDNIKVYIVLLASIISSIFLFLVLVVYALLPALRNLGGMILMAYVFSMMFAFIFLLTIQTQSVEEKDCLYLATTTYFFFLASFCWMNVMSFDIWWTFRGYAKTRPIHRRGENFKFRMYCLYGWGAPLAMSIFFYVINGTDLRHMPWFVKPQIPEMGCFIEGGQTLVYLYAPMLIMIMCNWIFFLMTAFNIWRLNRNTSMLDSPSAGTPATHRNQRTRFFIYLKLSIIMGINWVLEVVSSFNPNFEFWYITDLYNLLIGLSIFLIFICKKKIFIALKARLIILKRKLHLKPRRSLATKSQTSNTTLSYSSQDTLKVNYNPKETDV